MAGESSFETVAEIAEALSEELGLEIRVVYVRGLGHRIAVNGFDATSASAEEIIELITLAALLNGNLEHLILACCA